MSVLLSVIDSSAKSTPGVYKFEFTNVGNEEQCLGIHEGPSHHFEGSSNIVRGSSQNIYGSFSMIQISIPERTDDEIFQMNQPTLIPYKHTEKYGSIQRYIQVYIHIMSSTRMLSI